MKVYKQVRVFKNRTNKMTVSLGFDVSADTFVSEIRKDDDPTSELIATWIVTFETDGTDGELVLTLPQASVANTTKTVGYMDMKRVSSGESFAVFDDVIEVVFENTVTA